MTRKISQIPVRRKTLLFLPNLHQKFIESILSGKIDVSTYKKFIVQNTTDAEKYEMIFSHISRETLT